MIRVHDLDVDSTMAALPSTPAGDDILNNSQLLLFENPGYTIKKLRGYIARSRKARPRQYVSLYNRGERKYHEHE